jgi:Predicted secreted protein containing a PDZ domain
MSRRALTLMVAGLLTLLLGAVGAWLPVPYVVLSPGPTENTLGEVQGKPVISIEGRQTYPTSGGLNLVTVAYQGGPGGGVDLLTALRGWVDPTTAVVPQETIFPADDSVEEVEERNTREMNSSQQLATAAALNELKIPVRTVIAVYDTQEGSPAHGKLLPGDEILTVDGQAVSTTDEIAAAVQRHEPGQQVRFEVERNGKRMTVDLGVIPAGNGKVQVGVVMGPRFKFPFKVEITVGDVGGPSAGLMFSLGIYDKLTPGSLTGGKTIAGTGTIDEHGRVGAIGGIQQKMVGARNSGATIFLTPAENCAEAVKAVPNGLRLVKVETLRGALDAIEALNSGDKEAEERVPTCSSVSN